MRQTVCNVLQRCHQTKEGLYEAECDTCACGTVRSVIIVIANARLHTYLEAAGVLELVIEEECDICEYGTVGKVLCRELLDG